MQTLKSYIRNRILSAAKEQFVQRGYLKTSMREIADAVDVGVGNLYNYFENKDELFCVILRPVSDALERMLQEHHGAKGADIMLICSEEYLKSAVDEYISLINKHGELMKILLFHSQGSSLETFREDYTNRSTEIVKTWFAEMKEKHPVNGDLYFCLLLLILSAKPSNLEFQTIYTHARYTPFPCYR